MRGEDREERVQSVLQTLKDKHGASFTPMQLRIWSEIIAGELHASVDDPPTSSMFLSAGRSDSIASKKKKDGDSPMIEALTKAAAAISSALSPQTHPVSHTTAGSPGKLIDCRSKCYKQLSDLNNLKASGVLTEEEYSAEKCAIMCVLRRLKGE